MLAPIVLFIYNRPWHTRKTLESLEANDLSKEAELFIFADGPKKNASSEQLEKIKETRELIREKNWCGKINIIERDKNLGLAKSVISGVTEVVNKYGKIIVLEDDLILSKNFLHYMNNSLNLYEKSDKVMQISGYMFPVEITAKEDAFFLPFTTSWGWGTWKRVWDKFNEIENGLEILKKDKELRRKFDLDGSYPYFKMLKSQQEGKVDSWAIRFYLSVFLENGLVLYPKKTLVKNIGMDGSGVHCALETEQKEADNYFSIKNYSKLEILEEVKKEICKFLKKQNSFLNTGLRFLKQRLKTK